MMLTARAERSHESRSVSRALSTPTTDRRKVSSWFRGGFQEVDAIQAKSVEVCVVSSRRARKGWGVIRCRRKGVGLECLARPSRVRRSTASSNSVRHLSSRADVGVVRGEGDAVRHRQLPADLDHQNRVPGTAAARGVTALSVTRPRCWSSVHVASICRMGRSSWSSWRRWFAAVSYRSSAAVGRPAVWSRLFARGRGGGRAVDLARATSHRQRRASIRSPRPERRQRWPDPPQI